jgi:hypothetical protein
MAGSPSLLSVQQAEPGLNPRLFSSWSGRSPVVAVQRVSSVVGRVIEAAVVVAVVVVAARMTPTECVPLVESTADMRAVNVCAAHRATGMAGREGAGAAPEMHASPATDMCASKPATHMSTAEAAAHVAATASEAAAHVAATAAVASATTTVAAAATTVASATATASQSVRRYGNGSQRDSRGQDDCSLQLETLHRIFPSVSELKLIVIARRPPKCAISSAHADVDGDKSGEPAGSRCAVIDAVSSRLRNSVSRRRNQCLTGPSFGARRPSVPTI